MRGLGSKHSAACRALLVQPELRYEHSYNAPAYNYSTRKNQLTVAADVILFY